MKEEKKFYVNTVAAVNEALEARVLEAMAAHDA